MSVGANHDISAAELMGGGGASAKMNVMEGMGIVGNDWWRPIRTFQPRANGRGGDHQK